MCELWTFSLVVCSALSKVYTFGPTFRADLSHTRRHLAEFYMVEAEVCFVKELEDILRVIEGVYRSATTSLLEQCEADIDLLHKITGSVRLKVHTGDSVCVKTVPLYSVVSCLVCKIMKHGGMLV